MTASDTLLRKYNIPGPRYTSYPTVPYWTDSPTEQQWVESISQALVEGRTQGAGAADHRPGPLPGTDAGCTERESGRDALT
jgi:hypothetical protein